MNIKEIDDFHESIWHEYLNYDTIDEWKNGLELIDKGIRMLKKSNEYKQLKYNEKTCTF